MIQYHLAGENNSILHSKARIGIVNQEEKINSFRDSETPDSLCHYGGFNNMTFDSLEVFRLECFGLWVLGGD